MIFKHLVEIGCKAGKNRNDVIMNIWTEYSSIIFIFTVTTVTGKHCVSYGVSVPTGRCASLGWL